MSLAFPVDAKLKDGSTVQLVLAEERDVEPLRRLYQVIVEEGNSYPHDWFPDQDEFMDYWFRGKSTVAAYVPDRDRAADMVGAFYLKPNWPGRARHVANAGFIVARTGGARVWAGCWGPRCWPTLSNSVTVA